MPAQATDALCRAGASPSICRASFGVPAPDPVVSLDGRNVLIDNEEETRRTTDWANTVGREIFGD